MPGLIFMMTPGMPILVIRKQRHPTTASDLGFGYTEQPARRTQAAYGFCPIDTSYRD